MEKIAVVGLSCLFPDAKTPEEFWQNLMAQKDSVSPATEEKMSVDPAIFFDPEVGKKEHYYCTKGGFIKEFQFDATGYKLPADFLNSLDDIFKWSLYVAKQALKDSGYLNNSAILSKCGVILGNLSSPTRFSQRLISPIYRQAVDSALQELLERSDFHLAGLRPPEGMSLLNMLTAGYPTTVVAQALSLAGVHFSIDAACSSALYSVKLACHYLRSRKVDLMLAGAVSCADSFVNHTGFSLIRAYPEDGITRPLDRESGGLITGEGAGMLALKRYNDALRDGDKIYATILGVGTSNDGKGRYFLSPNPKGQVLAFERTYTEAGIDPKSITYIECHATGTDLGDKTELNSMDAFFGRYGAAPLVGSVKSNLGHLLTAAGMPSLIKTILSMSERLIPPTIHVEQPLSSANNVIAPEQVVRTTTPWPDNAPLQRAAVSAFGFGGTNAHLVMERNDESQLSPVPEIPFTLPALAIVGMDAFFGDCDGLNAFDRTIYEGKQHFIPVPPERWKGIDEYQPLLKKYGFTDGQAPQGAYLRDFDMDFLRFKIPPNANEQPIPQQLLLLQVADRALKDAGIEEGGKVASIVAMETELSGHLYRARCDVSWQLKNALAQNHLSLPSEELEKLAGVVKESLHLPAQVSRYISYIGNIMACRIAATWDFSGPAFTLSAQENSVFKALEVAQMLLAKGEVDAVVLGAVDLAGGAEHVLLRNLMTQVNGGTPTLSFDRNAKGWLVGEGAGAIVLKRLDTAKQQQDRIYAKIDAISLVQGNGTDDATGLPHPPTAETVAQACQQAFAAAGIAPADIGYLEVFGSGIPQDDEAEMQGLLRAYQTSESQLSCAIGSIKANIGHTYAASGMASLIKTVLCLYRRHIPATPQWSGPKHPEAWQGSPFYVPAESRPWILEKMARERFAAINGLGTDGTYAHLILSEEPSQVVRPNRHLEQAPFHLFPLAADSAPALLQQLQALEGKLADCPSLAAAARETFRAFQQQPQAAYKLAIVGSDREEVSKEIQRALKGVPKAFEKGGEWKTPLGSYFTTKPLGKQGRIAFVYPGAFNSYLGMGRDIFYLFPHFYEGMGKLAPGTPLKKILFATNELLYPKSLERLSKRQLEALDVQLVEQSLAMFYSGALTAVLHTKIVQDYFRVQPHSALGYSLGEVSMVLALALNTDVWESAEALVSRAESSPLLKTRISGPKNAVREAWGWPSLDTDEDSDFWGTYVLLSPLDAVKQVLRQENRVYLTHINTPQEVVIAGDKASCHRVIERLQCDAFPIPASTVIHCEPMHSEYGEMVQWLTLPVREQTPLNLYSSAECDRMALDSHSVVHRITKALCQCVDFPQLVHRSYDDGTRIFLELGPGGTCTRWIRENLKGKEHLALFLNRRGANDLVGIVRVLAQLVSHQVAIDLSPLYAPLQEAAAPKKSLIRTVTLGGCRIRSTIVTELTPENRKRFATRLSSVPHERVPVAAARQTASPQQPAVKEVVGAASVRSSGASGGNVGSNTRPQAIDNPSYPQHDMNPDDSRTKAASASETTESAPEVPPLNSYSLHYQKLQANTTRSTQAHASFLDARRESLRQMSEMVGLQIAVLERMLDAPPAQSSPPASQPPKPSGITFTKGSSRNANVVFDEAEVLEMAGGKLSRVFGEDFAIVDSYPKATRVPMPPYLFISRVTKLDAKRGCFEPCSIETEYDIPKDAWYALDGQVSGIIFIEASHGNIFLASYLGVDFNNKGQRVYRALGGSTTFLSDLPDVGETVRCKVSINSFSRSGNTLLFFFTHECYLGDRLFLRMESGAGFFSEKELNKGQGVNLTKREKQERQTIQKQQFTPLLTCSKTAFTEDDILKLSVGNLAACFGTHYEQNGKNPSLRLPSSPLRMIDRVTSVVLKGGAWGLGFLVAEKTLDPEHWYFNCHFKDDYCLPGTLLSEASSQLLTFYMLYLGLPTRTTNARFRPILNLNQTGRYRGQIKPTSATLTYQIEVTSIGLDPVPYATADAFIVFGGKTISIITNVGIQISENQG